MRKLLLIAILLLSLFSCSPRIVQENRTISAENIHSTFRNVKGHVHVPDPTYWAPSKEWVEDVLLRNYQAYLFNNSINYSQKFDCDDFAKMFSVYAAQVYSKLRETNTQTALPVAEFYYVPQTPSNLVIVEHFFGNYSQRHAINVIILNTGELYFVEPQIGANVSLTEKEAESAYFVKF